MSFGRGDIVVPESVEATALAIAQRANNDLFAATAGGAFDHATTAVSTTIPAALNTGITSTSSLLQLIAASTAEQDRINQNTQLINRVVYILEANGMTT